MPAAGHIVHMPVAHLLPDRPLHGLVADQLAAVRADEAYLAQAQAGRGIYPYGYYPHNIHFALVSAQMAGDAEHMVWAAERLNGKIPDEVAGEVGWIQAILPAPYFAHAQFSPPDVVLGLADPGDKFPFVQAMWHYARGVAHAAKGDLDAARAEAARISEINQTADFEMLLAWYVPAPDILRIARHVLEGRIAQAEGNLDQAIKEFEVAAQIQEALPYMEPEYWYYPVRQSLGATPAHGRTRRGGGDDVPGGSDRGPEQRLGAVRPDEQYVALCLRLRRPLRIARQALQGHRQDDAAYATFQLEGT